MKELPIEFTGKGETKGFTFTQVAKSNHGYIYKVNTGALNHYEVFRKMVNSRFDTISFPKTNSFGIWAWTTRNPERAKQIFAELEG